MNLDKRTIVALLVIAPAPIGVSLATGFGTIGAFCYMCGFIVGGLCCLAILEGLTRDLDK